MFVYILYGLFILSCVVLIVVILLQPGKADAGALFSSSVSSTAFGPRGTASLLAKITIGAAAAFMLIALMLALPSITRFSRPAGLLASRVGGGCHRYLHYRGRLAAHVTSVSQGRSRPRRRLRSSASAWAAERLRGIAASRARTFAEVEHSSSRRTKSFRGTRP